MFRISEDSPAYYLTSISKKSIPVFRTIAVKNIACSALDEARRSAGFLWDHHPQAKVLGTHNQYSVLLSNNRL
jgi:hypothetical protein